MNKQLRKRRTLPSLFIPEALQPSSKLVLCKGLLLLGHTLRRNSGQFRARSHYCHDRLSKPKVTASPFPHGHIQIPLGYPVERISFVEKQKVGSGRDGSL